MPEETYEAEAKRAKIDVDAWAFLNERHAALKDRRRARRIILTWGAVLLVLLVCVS